MVFHNFLKMSQGLLASIVVHITGHYTSVLVHIKRLQI